MSQFLMETTASSGIFPGQSGFCLWNPFLLATSLVERALYTKTEQSSLSSGCSELNVITTEEPENEKSKRSQKLGIFSRGFFRLIQKKYFYYLSEMI